MSWRVEYEGRTAYVTGPKADARRRIEACGGRNPIWVRRRSAWATSPEIASRVLDQIEGRQPVAVSDVDQHQLEFAETVPANLPPAQGGLW